jgi:3-dehydroquinate synthase
MNPPGTLVQQFSVPFRYEVAFTRGVFRPDNPVLRDILSAREPQRRHRALVVLDAGVAASHPDLGAAIAAYFDVHEAHLELVAPVVLLPGGEAAKNDPALITRLHTTLYAHHIDRQSFVIAIGGGAVLDAAGYAAATCHRGVRTVRLPTTVLSQNDSGVGVKNGINAFGAKNYLGTFFPPFAVVNDLDLLATLPRRERVAGYAEAIKVALIRDAAFFDWIEANAVALARGEAGPLAHLVVRSAELHARHIAQAGDPFELGSAKPLDFGHWSAHKLESLTDHELRHGEAVGLGVALDSRYSAAVGLLAQPEAERIEAVLLRVGLPTWHPALELRKPDGRRAVLDGIEDFREHLGGELTVTLLRAIGQGVEVNTLDTALLERLLDARAQAQPAGGAAGRARGAGRS